MNCRNFKMSSIFVLPQFNLKICDRDNSENVCNVLVLCAHVFDELREIAIHSFNNESKIVRQFVPA